MIHTIRSSYWYTDEYILWKTLAWVSNCIELIAEERYTNNLQLASLVQLHIHNIFAGKNDSVNIPSWDELSLDKKTDVDDASDEDLNSLWIWIV